MDCVYCAISEGKVKPATIYEDSKVIAVLPDEPAVVGHVILIPKIHTPIFEELDDDTTSYVFNMANKISKAMFDSGMSEGTNMLVNNGDAEQDIPHFSVNILSRKEKDGLNFEWTAKLVSSSEHEETAKQLKEVLDKMTNADALQDLREDHDEKIKPENDYLVKQMRRVP